MLPRSAMKGYQHDAAALAVERQRLGMLLAPGDGKTVTALTALTDAHALPALVAAPSLVVETDVWGAEAASWEHLAGLRVQPVAGTERQRLAALWAEADVYTISYENLLWLTEEVTLAEEYRALVFDELSKMKTPGTKRFKRMRSRSGGIEVPFRLGLTGSPVGNHLLDLWGELHMVVPGSLGDTFGGFREEHFETRDYNQRVWVLKGMRCEKCRGKPTRCEFCRRRPTVHTVESRRHEAAIYKLARPHVYARPTSKREGIPPVREVIRRVPMPATLERAALELRRQLWTKLPSGAELEALSESVIAMKLRQLAGGAAYVKGKVWEPLHDAKVRATVDLVDELQGEPLLLYYWFEHERERLVDALGAHAREATEPGAIAAWNEREVDVLLAHPQSAGMGLNLQRGGHHVGWFSLPWARWQYDQGVGRLDRLGQPAEEVTSHLLLCGPADDDVVQVLAVKGATEHRFMQAMRRQHNA